MKFLVFAVLIAVAVAAPAPGAQEAADMETAEHKLITFGTGPTYYPAAPAYPAYPAYPAAPAYPAVYPAAAPAYGYGYPAAYQPHSASIYIGG